MQLVVHIGQLDESGPGGAGVVQSGHERGRGGARYLRVGGTAGDQRARQAQARDIGVK